MRARPILLLLALGLLSACGGGDSPTPSGAEPPASPDQPGARAEEQRVAVPAAIAEPTAQTDNSLANASITLIGEARGDEAGCAVAIAGDVNRDGLDDLLVGAWASESATGKAYLMLGRAEGWDALTELAQADATFVGEALNDLAGFSLAGIGDVDGDGIDDFAISAQGNDTDLQNRGRVYLFRGREAADWGRGLSLAEADMIIQGQFENDHAGFAIAGLGDVDGDGIDDFALSKQCNLSDGSHQGVIQIHLGSPVSSEIPREDITLRGEQRGGLLGHSLAGVGDVNGDGFDDFVAGAPELDLNDLERVGAVYLIRGRERRAWPRGTQITGVTNIFFPGDQEESLTGKSVAAAGDVNGDGLDDFLIGAPRNRERQDVGSWMGGAGQTYLVLGSERAAREVPLSGSVPSFLGQGEEDQSGAPVAPAGDVNGDGFDDFMVGAPMRDEGLSNNGEIYLIMGAAEGWGPDRLLPVAAARSWVGARNGDRAGSALAGGGDLNGDGVDDIVIGLPHADAHGPSTGQIHVLLSGRL